MIVSVFKNYTLIFIITFLISEKIIGQNPINVIQANELTQITVQDSLIQKFQKSLHNQLR